MEPQDIFTSVRQSITLLNSEVKDCTPFVSGFFDVYENSRLVIESSDFNNIYSIGSGTVVFGNYKSNIIIIRNSTFTNNYAILGGVFYTQF
jgi:hypothetical protein